MFVGRTKELKFLEEYFNSTENEMVVVYGRSGIGKTELLRLFSQDKNCFYYKARDCSEQEQLAGLQTELRERYYVERHENIYGEEEVSAYHQLFDEVLTTNQLTTSGNGSDRLVVILEEFQLCVRHSDSFLPALVHLLTQEERPVMLIVSCSSVNWVENDMVSALAEASTYISALLKVKEFSYLELSARFPDYSREECMIVYGILGGIPQYLNYWNPKRSVKENIIHCILHKDSRLFQEAQRYLKSELRELSQYNTILAELAKGKHKLNELYEATGFSRAKISVYLKNLNQLEVTEKAFSLDQYRKENTKKGLYQIQDHYIHFWYQFVFPNQSDLEQHREEWVYEYKVKPCLEEYLYPYYSQMVVQYMGMLNEYKKLPFSVSIHGKWFGKEGTIDYIGTDEQNHLIVAKCKWSSQPMSVRDYENFLFLVMQVGMNAQYYYLFSKAGFTEELQRKVEDQDHVKLLNLDDM